VAVNNDKTSQPHWLPRLKLPRLGSNLDTSDPEARALDLFFTTFRGQICKIAVLPRNSYAECSVGESWLLQLAGGENT
jgi:hypothetical protein